MLPPKPYPGRRPQQTSGKMLRNGVRRARITRLQRIVAHITLLVWPTKHAMQLLGKVPFDDEEEDWRW